MNYFFYNTSESEIKHTVWLKSIPIPISSETVWTRPILGHQLAYCSAFCFNTDINKTNCIYGPVSTGHLLIEEDCINVIFFFKFHQKGRCAFSILYSKKFESCSIYTCTYWISDYTWMRDGRTEGVAWLLDLRSTVGDAGKKDSLFKSLLNHINIRHKKSGPFTSTIVEAAIWLVEARGQQKIIPYELGPDRYDEKTL